VMVFFEIWSWKLFSQASFKLWCSWSLPPEYPGLQAWATSTWQTRVFLKSYYIHRYLLPFLLMSIICFKIKPYADGLSVK
jgi:hypothetical protein